MAIRYARYRPSIDRDLHPNRQRHGANASMLSHQVDNIPATIALLNMRESKRCYFGPPKTAAEKDRYDGAIAQPLHRPGIWRADDRCAWLSESQLPARTPIDLLLSPRLMPAASAGASSPLSAASAASLRIADIRTMIDDEPSAGLQRYPLRAHGGLGEAGRGASWNHARNSSSAIL